MTTQDAVNPIESLDTWTEFVEGKNKVWTSQDTEWLGPLDLFSFCFTFLCQQSRTGMRGIALLLPGEG